MEIIVNGESMSIEKPVTVGQLIALRNEGSGGIAVARNGKLVRRQDWDHTQVDNGDDIVIIKAAYGG